MITSLNEKECSTLLANNYLGYLSYIYKSEPFVVPITYYFDNKSTVICYSNEGHKSKAIRINKKVALVTSSIKDLNTWKSVQARGICEELFGSSIKASLRDFTKGIKDIALQNKNLKFNFLNDFSNKVDNKTMHIVFKIHITNLVGKSCFYNA